jgi:hypothetical protein
VIGVWRGNVGRADMGRRGRFRYDFWRRRHHACRAAVLRLLCGVRGLSQRGGLLVFVASPRVGIRVYARVARQLVGSAKPLGASRKRAGVGLLPGVCPDVTGLVLQAVEGLVAERTLVRTGKLCPLILHQEILLHTYRRHHGSQVTLVHRSETFVILKRHRPVEGSRIAGLLLGELGWLVLLELEMLLMLLLLLRLDEWGQVQRRPLHGTARCAGVWVARSGLRYNHR